MSTATAIVPARAPVYRYGPDWRSEAACRGAGSVVFITPKSPARAWRPVCDRCPVAEVCLWAAMADEQVAAYRHGVWGGCTPARRDRIAGSLPADTDYGELFAAAVGVWAERRRL